MTREEAIKIMEMRECCRECVVSDFTCKDCDTAFEMAIKALEQQTCEDAVSREAVLGLFAQNADATRPYNKTWEEVKALPSVNPQRTGHWIQTQEKDDAEPCILWECSCCHKEFRSVVHKVSNYCPSCGSYNGGD